MTRAAKPKTLSKPEKNSALHDDLSHLAKAIIANAGVGIYIVQNGKFVYVSELYQKLSGYTDTELLGTYSLNNIYSDDKEMVREEAIKCLKGESFKPYEYRFIKKNNEVMWVLETITPIVYKDDRATLGSFMDITERKKVEEKLHKEEQWFRALAELSADIIIFVNREGIITYENPAVERYLGLKVEERIGVNLFERIHPDDLKFAMDVFNKFTLDNLSKDINSPVRQIRIRHQDGNWRTFETSASKLLQNNIVESVIINLRDITERKKTEEELRQSEEKYRLIFEYSPLGLLSFDGKGVIVACNDNFVKIIGSSREKLIGLNMLNLPDKNIVSVVQKALNGSPGFYENDYSSVTARKISLVRCLFAPMNVGDGQIPGGVGIIEDITERKQMEFQRQAALDALRKSEDKYRTLIETTDTGYVIIDYDGLVRDANSEYVRLTGHHDLSEIMGRSVMEWTAESEKEKNAEAVKTCFDKGYIRNLEIDYVDAEGNVRPIEINATCIEIEGETCTITICRDISQRKRANDMLKESENKYRLLADNIHDVVFVMDMNLNYTYISPSVKILRGYEPEEAMKHKPAETMTPSSVNLALSALSEIMEIEKSEHRDINISRTLQLEMSRKNGTTFWVETKASFIRDENQRPVGIMGLTRDITERKKVEDALRESEYKYKSLIENIPDIIFTIDLEGKITFVSKRAKEISGYESAEMINRNIFNFIPEEAHQRTMEKLQKGMKGEKIKHIQMPVTAKSGEKLFFEFSFSRIYKDGAVVGAQGTAVDITERKKAEDELRESELRYRELSIIDDLTQLYNSRHFYAQLEREMERSNRYEQPLTILMLDIDKFKAFNDTYGHIEGDYVLSRLGEVVKRCLRETDSAYRYGGEEFTIMLPMTTSEEGIVTAKRIQTELKEVVFSPVLGQEVYITVSMGLAQYKPKEEIRAFVNRVDRLMYQAKRDGRDRICLES